MREYLARRRCAHRDKLVAKVQTCSRCKRASYCDATCQKAHWKQHKVTCKPADAVPQPLRVNASTSHT